jgi:hypothetical protein
MYVPLFQVIYSVRIQMTVLKNVVENRDIKMRDMPVAHVLDHMFALIVVLTT